jgi:DnaK suppressor protein
MEGTMDVEAYRDQLLALERDLRQKLGREVEDARDTQDDQFEGSDEASIEDQRDDSLRLAQTDTEIFEAVRDALRRIDDGTYGRCTVDGEPIPEARLRAVPWAPYCAKHQQRAEELAGLRTPRL